MNMHMHARADNAPTPCAVNERTELASPECSCALQQIYDERLRTIQLQCSNVKDAQSTLATFLDTLTCVLGHIISCHDTGTIGSPVNGLFACTTPSSF